MDDPNSMREKPDISPRGEWLLRRMQEAHSSYCRDAHKIHEEAAAKGYSKRKVPTDPERFPALAMEEDLSYAAKDFLDWFRGIPDKPGEEGALSLSDPDHVAAWLLVAVMLLVREDPLLEFANHPVPEIEEKLQAAIETTKREKPNAFISVRGERLSYCLLETVNSYMIHMSKEFADARARGVTDLNTLEAEDLPYTSFIHDCHFAMGKYHRWFAYYGGDRKKKPNPYPMNPETLCHFALFLGLALGREERLEKVME